MGQSIASRKSRLWWISILGTSFAVLLCAGAWSVSRSQANRRAFAELQWLATDIDYESTAPDWLRGLVGDDRVDRWGIFEQVKSINLRGDEVTDKVLAFISRFKHLRVLNLRNAGVTNEGLAHLAGLQNLIVLRLDGARITDAGLEHVVKLRRLKYFGLDGTLVTDQAMPGLARLPALSKLEVKNTAVTPWGVQPLRDAIPNIEFEGYQFVLPLLHEAAKQGNLAQIAKQLEKGVDVDLSMEDISNYGKWEGTTPLMWTAARGKPEAVCYLIDAGADLEAKNPEG